MVAPAKGQDIERVTVSECVRCRSRNSARTHGAESELAAKRIRLHMIDRLEKMVQSGLIESLCARFRLSESMAFDLLYAIQVTLFPEEFEPDPEAELLIRELREGVLERRPRRIAPIDLKRAVGLLMANRS